MALQRGILAFVLSVTLVAGAGLVPATAVVGANHGAEMADFTVEPMSDRSPGATNVRYGMVVVGEGGTDFRTLESMTAVYEEGSFAACTTSKSETFGIDRGNTHAGYEVDENLEKNTKQFSAGEDVFEVQFNGEDDFGGSTHLNDGDAIISVAKCIDNPDDPGWYQISGSSTGITESGERKTFGDQSHYFWVCDCANEAEAREKLGPSPADPEPTAMPEPSGSTDDGDGTGDGASTEDSTGSSTTGDGAAATTPAPTPTLADTGPATPTATPTSTPASSWDRHVVQTPTPGSGDGFGGHVAIVAIATVALLVRRRS